MKIAEYQQMMDYLTGPRERFNGGGSVKNKTVLPKKKPEEEVKKRKIKNFEKVKGALENPKEVKEMIDKPKRGLVDEPGKYSQPPKAKTALSGGVKKQFKSKSRQKDPYYNVHLFVHLLKYSKQHLVFQRHKNQMHYKQYQNTLLFVHQK